MSAAHPSRQRQRESATVEYRVCVLNDGTPHGPLHLSCAGPEEAERTRKSWANDPDLGEVTGSQVWIESRAIGPWERRAAGGTP